jgi:hypothetical protein
MPEMKYEIIARSAFTLRALRGTSSLPLPASPKFKVRICPQGASLGEEDVEIASSERTSSSQ